MNNSFSGYRKNDLLIALFLSLFLILIVTPQLTTGMTHWGDDFAAYISEGIAIAEGVFEEQTARNHFMHPTPLPEEAENSSLVYVWGFPLLLSFVYRLVGFDLVNYSSFFYYKLPLLFSFAIMAGVLYLFYRRYFRELPAALLTLIFCAGSHFVEGIDTISVDIVFLSAAMLSFLLAESFFDTITNTTSLRTRLLLSVALGLSMWFTYETRLNGNTVIYIILIIHGIRLFQNAPTFSLRQVLRNICPYFIFIVLKVISEQILSPSTSNLSDIGNITFSQLLYNLRYYWELTGSFLITISGNLLLYPAFLFLGIGILNAGFQRRNLAYTIFVAGTYGVLILLPYQQGLRYLYNILPFLLLFVALGIQSAVRWLAKKDLFPNGFNRHLSAVIAAIILITVYTPMVKKSYEKLVTPEEMTDLDVYNQDSIDIFHYIQEHTSPDSVIAFIKPRALYLNTQRLSFRPDVNNHSIDHADYFLIVSFYPPEYDMQGEYAASFKLIYENRLFTLYENTEHLSHH